MYESSSKEIENELKKAQDLNKLLSIYKNQEYPEKLLQINNLKKKLTDISNLYSEEHDSLIEMIKSEKQLAEETQNSAIQNVTSDVSSVSF